MSETIKPAYQKFGDDDQGVFRIGAVDCSLQKKICDKEKVTAFPTIKIYPPYPAPAIDVEVNAKLEGKQIR